MPSFCKQSLMKLAGCHPELQVLFHEVIRWVDCSVLEGYRDQQQQDADFAAGKSKLKWPLGQHNQNPSLAVDVMPYPIDYSNINRIYHFAGFVSAIAIMLKKQGKMDWDVRWGGDWSGDLEFKPEKFFDGAHFELTRD